MGCFSGFGIFTLTYIELFTFLILAIIFLNANWCFSAVFAVISTRFEVRHYKHCGIHQIIYLNCVGEQSWVQIWIWILFDFFSEAHNCICIWWTYLVHLVIYKPNTTFFVFHLLERVYLKILNIGKNHFYHHVLQLFSVHS